MGHVNTPTPLPSGGAAVAFDTSDDDYVTSVGGYGGHSLHVLGHGWIVQPKHSNFVVAEAVIQAADVSSLRDAMLDGSRCCSRLPASPERILVALDPQGRVSRFDLPARPGDYLG